MIRIFSQLSFTVLATAGVLAFTGCKKPEIRAYDAPRDEPSPLAQLPPAGETPAPDQKPAGAKPMWKKPDSWAEKEPSSMRLASFASPEKDGESADISIVALGGPAGGTLANVNRWRTQIALDPVDEAGLKPLLADQTISGKSGQIIDMAGTQAPSGKTKPQRTIAAWVEAGGQTWFFKMSGEDSVVAAEKPSFIEFLTSVQFP